MRVALISLEPWDDVWRRNQHLSGELIQQRMVDEVLFVAPPSRHPTRPFAPKPGVRVINPDLRLPRSLGGLRECARRLRRDLQNVDLIWVNNATVGVHLLDQRPAVYDVTDDWRCARQSKRELRRLLRAEHELARRARTIVCSEVLAERWRERYGVDTAVVHNGVDLAVALAAEPATLGGPPPHIGYVGTLHAERLDIGLVLRLAREVPEATVHLVGPNSLDAAAAAALDEPRNIRVEPPVDARQVPSVLRAMDVLVCPHVVTEFTLSLDAIKAYEYRAARRPIVATPTSGFQELTPGGCLAVVDADSFVEAVRAALQSTDTCPPPDAIGWDVRAREFAAAALSRTWMT